MPSSSSKSFSDSIRKERDQELSQTEKMLDAVTSFFGSSGINRIEIGDMVIETQSPDNKAAEDVSSFLNCFLIRVQSTEGIPMFGSRNKWTDTEVGGKIDLVTLQKIAPSAVVHEHVGSAFNSFDAIVIAVPESQVAEYDKLQELGGTLVLPGLKNKCSIAYSNGPLTKSYFEKISAANLEYQEAHKKVDEAAERSYVLSQLRQAGKYLVLAHDTGRAQQFGLPTSILEEVDKWDRLFREAKASEQAAKRQRDKAYVLEGKCRASLWVTK